MGTTDEHFKIGADCVGDWLVRIFCVCIWIMVKFLRIAEVAE